MEIVRWMNARRISRVWIKADGCLPELARDRRGLPVFRVPAGSAPA
jgi:hypothetical protein